MKLGSTLMALNSEYQAYLNPPSDDDDDYGDDAPGGSYGGGLYGIGDSTTTAPVRPRLWSLAAWGEDLVANEDGADAARALEAAHREFLET